MDLAQALPGHDIGAMSEREFKRWMLYARRKGLWFRRLEFMFAQLTCITAQTMAGAKNVTNADYLIDPTRDERGYMVDPRQREVDIDVEAIARDFM